MMTVYCTCKGGGVGVGGGGRVEVKEGRPHHRPGALPAALIVEWPMKPH